MLDRSDTNMVLDGVCVVCLGVSGTTNYVDYVYLTVHLQEAFSHVAHVDRCSHKAIKGAGVRFDPEGFGSGLTEPRAAKLLLNKWHSLGSSQDFFCS